MPKGYSSGLRENTSLDSEIVNLYLNEFFSINKLAKIYCGSSNSSATIKIVLERNNVNVINSNGLTFRGDLKKCPKCLLVKDINCFDKHKTHVRSWCKLCRSNHEIRNEETQKKWKVNNIDKLRAGYKRKTQRIRSTPLGRALDRVRTSIHFWMKKSGVKKSKRAIKYLNYNAEDFQNHLEKLFKDGMTWDNYGKWHIDHIRPIASFDIQCEQDISIVWSLDNLQPLWAEDNLKKGSLYNGYKHFKNRKKEWNKK